MLLLSTLQDTASASNPASDTKSSSTASGATATKEVSTTASTTVPEKLNTEKSEPNLAVYIALMAVFMSVFATFMAVRAARSKKANEGKSKPDGRSGSTSAKVTSIDKLASNESTPNQPSSKQLRKQQVAAEERARQLASKQRKKEKHLAKLAQANEPQSTKPAAVLSESTSNLEAASSDATSPDRDASIHTPLIAVITPAPVAPPAPTEDGQEAEPLPISASSISTTTINALRVQASTAPRKKDKPKAGAKSDRPVVAGFQKFERVVEQRRDVVFEVEERPTPASVGARSYSSQSDEAERPVAAAAASQKQSIPAAKQASQKPEARTLKDFIRKQSDS